MSDYRRQVSSLEIDTVLVWMLITVNVGGDAKSKGKTRNTVLSLYLQVPFSPQFPPDLVVTARRTRIGHTHECSESMLWPNLLGANSLSMGAVMSMTQPIRKTRMKGTGSPHTRLFGTGPLTSNSHCAVIVAHPGDEIAAAGCLLSKLVNVSILHVTDGAPRDQDQIRKAGVANSVEYAEARRDECLSALKLADIPPDQVFDLGVSDHEAPNFLTKLTRRITTFLQETGANIVLTHPYEGGHPDHDATAFATHAAMRMLRRNGFRPPVLFEMALHPSHDGQAKLPQFLTQADQETTTLLLDERARKLKQKMFDCFETQREFLRLSPVGPERFRQQKTYDFSKPPREGKLYYETFDDSFDARTWQTLASQALTELFSNHHSPEVVKNPIPDASVR